MPKGRLFTCCHRLAVPFRARALTVASGPHSTVRRPVRMNCHQRLGRHAKSFDTQLPDDVFSARSLCMIDVYRYWTVPGRAGRSARMPRTRENPIMTNRERVRVLATGLFLALALLEGAPSLA